MPETKYRVDLAPEERGRRLAYLSVPAPRSNMIARTGGRA